MNLLDSVGPEDFDEKLTIVLLLEIEVLFLVLGVRQVLRKLLDFLCQVLEATYVLLALWLLLLYLLLLIDWFAVGTVLDLGLGLLRLLCCLLRLFGVVVFLKVFFSHFALDDHQTRVDERLLEKLTLKHSH